MRVDIIMTCCDVLESGTYICGRIERTNIEHDVTVRCVHIPTMEVHEVKVVLGKKSFSFHFQVEDGNFGTYGISIVEPINTIKIHNR